MMKKIIIIFESIFFLLSLNSLDNNEMKKIDDLFKKIVNANIKKDLKTLFSLISPNVEMEKQASEDAKKLLKELWGDEENSENKSEEEDEPYKDRKDLTNLDIVIYKFIDKEIKLANVRIKTSNALSSLFEEESVDPDTKKYEDNIKKLEAIKKDKGYKLFSNLLNSLNDPQLYVVPFEGVSKKYKIIEDKLDSDILTLTIEPPEGKTQHIKEFGFDEPDKENIVIVPNIEVKLIKDKKDWKLYSVVFSKEKL